MRRRYDSLSLPMLTFSCLLSAALLHRIVCFLSSAFSCIASFAFYLPISYSINHASSLVPFLIHRPSFIILLPHSSSLVPHPSSLVPRLTRHHHPPLGQRDHPTHSPPHPTPRPVLRLSHLDLSGSQPRTCSADAGGSTDLALCDRELGEAAGAAEGGPAAHGGRAVPEEGHGGGA